MINATQEAILSLMARTRFNNLDGKHVVVDLRAHPDLWEAVLLTRLDSLITLRDLRLDLWNADTLYILTTNEKLPDLQKLARSWSADEIDVMAQDEAEDLLGEFPAEVKVLQIWWD